MFPVVLYGCSGRIWEDNIKVDIKEVEWVVMDRIDLAQDTAKCRAVVNTVVNSQGP